MTAIPTTIAETTIPAARTGDGKEILFVVPFYRYAFYLRRGPHPTRL